jgi:hypothetical protein
MADSYTVIFDINAESGGAWFWLGLRILAALVCTVMLFNSQTTLGRAGFATFIVVVLAIVAFQDVPSIVDHNRLKRESRSGALQTSEGVLRLARDPNSTSFLLDGRRFDPRSNAGFHPSRATLERVLADRCVRLRYITGGDIFWVAVRSSGDCGGDSE